MINRVRAGSMTGLFRQQVNTSDILPKISEAKQNEARVGTLLQGEAVVYSSLIGSDGVEGPIRPLCCGAKKRSLSRDLFRRILPESALIYTLCITSNFEIALYRQTRKQNTALVEQFTSSATGALFSACDFIWTIHEESPVTITYKMKVDNNKPHTTCMKGVAGRNFYFTLAKTDANHSFLEWLELNSEMSISCLAVSLKECRRGPNWCIQKSLQRIDSIESRISQSLTTTLYLPSDTKQRRRAHTFRLPDWV